MEPSRDRDDRTLDERAEDAREASAALEAERSTTKARSIEPRFQVVSHLRDCPAPRRRARIRRWGTVRGGRRFMNTKDTFDNIILTEHFGMAMSRPDHDRR